MVGRRLQSRLSKRRGDQCMACMVISGLSRFSRSLLVCFLTTWESGAVELYPGLPKQSKKNYPKGMMMVGAHGSTE